VSEPERSHPTVRVRAPSPGGASDGPRTILFAAEYYPPFAPGGAEWSNAAWARGLARRGHRVVVVTPNYGAAAREDADGVSVVRVPFPVKLRHGQGDAGWAAHRNPAFHAYFAWQLARVARDQDADVIHAQGKGVLVAASIAGAVGRRPVLATIRDTGLLCPLGMCPLFEPGPTFDCSTSQYVRRCAPFFLEHYVAGAGPLRRALTWASLLAAWMDQQLKHLALRRARGIVGVSRGILRVHPARLFDPERASVVHTLPPAVDDSSLPAPGVTRRRLQIGDAPFVLYAGKLSLGKGTPVLVEAMDVVRRAVPRTVFVFAGKGDLRVPPADDVRVLGSIPQGELFALYRAADVVVVPSTWPEPLSRVLLEAMRLGRPIVATAVGGTPEVVEDGVTGLLVPGRDPRALGEAISGLLQDPERRQRMGAEAARRLERVFDEERVIDALLDAYRAALERPR
jgi:glycosyltransferase involved in cell wall biosynthesis